MERFTSKNDKGIPYIQGYPQTVGLRAVKKLSDIEDLEEQNLLVILPCNFGASLYRIVNGKDGWSKKQFKFIRKIEFNKNNYFDVLDNFGKTIFLTPEKAQTALSNQV